MVLSLIEQAEAAYPIVEASLFLELTDYDLAGVCILAMLAAQKGSRRWCTGRLASPIAEQTGSSISISRIHLLVEILGGYDYLHKKLKRSASSDRDITVQTIFNELGFYGIKGNKDGSVINACMVNWSLRKRPCKLMHTIPSPMQVLRMQASGERVVTVFLRLEELSRMHNSPLVYSEGMQDHCKDPLAFTLHDLFHMENYMDSRIHLEQCGFFACILRLPLGPKSFFCTTCKLDELFWQHLEYAISDMNCFLPHLLQYVLAKMLAAVERESSEDAVFERTSTIWTLFLTEIGMEPESPAREAAESMLLLAFKRRADQPSLSAAEGEELRTWFRQQCGYS